MVKHGQRSMVYGLSSALNWYKKSRPWLGRLSFSLSDLLYSHRSHPNRKLILNNKDHKYYYNNGEAEQRCIHWLVTSPDYRRKRKSVKGGDFRFGQKERLHFVLQECRLTDCLRLFSSNDALPFVESDRNVSDDHGQGNSQHG